MQPRRVAIRLAVIPLLVALFSLMAVLVLVTVAQRLLWAACRL